MLLCLESEVNIDALRTSYKTEMNGQLHTLFTLRIPKPVIQVDLQKPYKGDIFLRNSGFGNGIGWRRD